jgi:hypothetical protein
LSELADYRKSTGTAMFLQNTTAKTLRLGHGSNQRINTGCTRKTSHMTLLRIQELESLGLSGSLHRLRKGNQRKQASTMTRRVFARGPWRHQACAKQQHRLKLQR